MSKCDEAKKAQFALDRAREVVRDRKEDLDDEKYLRDKAVFWAKLFSPIPFLNLYFFKKQ